MSSRLVRHSVHARAPRIMTRVATDDEEGRMLMAFTRVDPYDPDRAFTLTLGVNEHNEFECTRMRMRSPMPGALSISRAC